jgi:hypothetical protein
VAQDSDLTAASGEALWPESIQALEYVRTRAARLSAAGLRERVRAAAQELESLLAELTEAEARARPFPDKWTIAEVVDHIAQTQIRAAEELRHLLEGRRPPGPPVYEGLRSGAAAWVPWSELAEGLRSANRELVALLETVADESAVPSGATARSILVIHRAEPGNHRTTQIFASELGWKEYALVQRLHLIDHRNQIMKLREAQAKK